MTILHCTDLHARDHWFEQLVGLSSGIDLVAISGDLLDFNKHEPNRAGVYAVRTHLGKIKTQLALCSGNHDCDPDDPQLIHAAWLQELRDPRRRVHGDSFEFGEFTVRCIPWMTPLSPALSPNEIWLIHAPPEGTETSIVRGGIDWGDFSFAELCRNGYGPRLALCGHVHDRRRWWDWCGETLVINPGCDLREAQLRYAIVDLLARTVTFRDERVSFSGGVGK